MSVYTDTMGHLMAFTNDGHEDHEELHRFARRLGLKRKWFQDQHPRPAFWHYDLTTPMMRAKAINAGAIPVALDTMGMLINRAWREGG